jgi:hypothetical protein
MWLRGSQFMITRSWGSLLRTWRDPWSLEPRWSMACDNMLPRLAR